MTSWIAYLVFCIGVWRRRPFLGLIAGALVLVFADPLVEWAFKKGWI